jgi:hypothetical protein
LVYRSSQPESNLEDLATRYHLASILNLRGGTFADGFYKSEVRLSKKHGIDFYDLPMSAIRRPSRGQLLRLLDLFEHCRYPLLIHCKSGSDRTGLVSALYLLYRGGQTPRDATRAFSLYYGHLPIGGTAHLHEPFDEYEQWLAERSAVHSPVQLRWWIENVYQTPGQADWLPPLHAGPRDTVDASIMR